MAQKTNRRRLAANEAIAITKNIRTSERKIGLVAGLIQNKPVSIALAELAFSTKRIARDVLKTLQSAIANAENNHRLDVDKLYVKEASVGRAFALRRFHTRGRGRSARVVKPFSHLRIIVAEKTETQETRDGTKG